MSIINGTSKRDILHGTVNADIINGLDGNDDLFGGSGNDLISGGKGLDKLFGEAGNDTLDGGLGADTMKGGSDNDLYKVDNAGDVVDESVAGSSGIDTVQSSVTFSLANALQAKGAIENLTLTGLGNINATGNNTANILIGNAGANILDGGLLGDTMKGGGGNDTYIRDHSGDVIIEAANAGIDLVKATVTTTLGANVENLTLLGSVITGTGNTLANIITGNAAANTLNGGDGNDVLIGGAGGDVLNGGSGTGDFASYETSTGAVIAKLQPLPNFDFFFTASGDALGDTFTGIENLRGTNNTTGITRQDSIAIQDILIGGSGVNTLEGLAGNDILYGGGGADRLDGGAGEDMAFYFTSGGVTASLAAPGLNTGDAAGDIYVSIEDLAGDVFFNDTLIGNSGNNRLWGLGGEDILRGGGGNDVLSGGSAFGTDLHRLDRGDTLDGGDGIDTADYSHAFGGVTIDLVNGTGTGGEANGDTLISIENVNGTGTEDTIFASLAANRLDGGGSFDIVDYSHSTSGVSVNLVAHTASGGFAAGDVLINIESLDGSAFTDTLRGADGGTILDGRGGNDKLTGGTGNDQLIGGLGVDEMTGGGGDDTYYVDATGDIIKEGLADGDDTVNSTATYALSANVEFLNLVAGAGAIGGTGNALANTINGNESANRIDGGAGEDQMTGGSGNDTYVVDETGDIVIEDLAGGDDTVNSTVTYALTEDIEILNLAAGAGAIDGTGNALANTINGNGFANRIDGGAGEDQMAGGDGNDTYVVNATLDLVAENNGEGTDKVIVTAAVSYTLAANVENLEGTALGFIGIGNSLGNVISTAANGRIDGRGGLDTLTGAGAGHTTEFVLHSGMDMGVDTLTNFGAGANFLDIAAAEFPIRQVAPGYNLFNNTANVQNIGVPQLLFDNETSNLYFSPNGVGGDEVLIATLTGVIADLTAEMFFVI